MMATLSCTAWGVVWWGSGRGGGGLKKYAPTCKTFTGEGLGLDDICNDPRFNFLTNFSEDEYDDTVPDSFFINNQCSPYANINLNCSYVETEKLKNLDSGKFTVLSLNIQSLPAKFNEFSELMTEFPSFESCPEIICLQETWNVVDNSVFPLANYHPLITNLRRSARGGGVGMYIKENLSFKILSKFSIFVERIFESVFIEVSLTNGKKS